MNQEEIWKDIKGYEGLYQVSSFGRVRSLDRVITSMDEKRMPYKSMILKQSLDKDGYLYIKLSKNKKQKHFRSHRLVGARFVKNPFNKPEINHINGIKTDNTPDNLEWVTSKENQKHAFDIGLQKALRGSENTLSIPIVQLSLENDYIAEYESAMIAESETGIYQGNISRNCRKGINYSAGGFRWIYKKDYYGT